MMTHEEFDQKAQEILKVVPEEFHPALRAIAWDMGHAYGYSEVLNVLKDIVYGFQTHRVFEKYEQRVREQEFDRIAGQFREKGVVEIEEHEATQVMRMKM